MSDFENEVAKKIKEQLENGELDNISEEIEESLEVANEDIEHTEINEETEVKTEEKDDNIIEDVFNDATSGVINQAFNMNGVDKNKHYNRKEKIRSLGLISGILGLIMAIGVLAIAVLVFIKFVPITIKGISGIVAFFTSDKMIVLTIIVGWVFALVGIVISAFPLIVVATIFIPLCISVFQLAINCFKTMRQPKQVFAFDRACLGNIILSFIFSAVVGFIGLAMFMDKDQSRFVSILLLSIASLFLLVAIIMLIDRINGKKAYRNLADQQEKQEIKAEADARYEEEKRKKRTKKKVKRLLDWVLRKK